MFWGSGGVGLSLVSSQIAAIYGSELRRYYDPNIFYTDEELRKVLELLVGGIIFTGEERPVVTR